jgi:uncharacterized protein (TIGR00369 family)
MTTSPDRDFEARVRDSFAHQNALALVRAQITEVAPGQVEIRLPHWDGILQQHGYIHGGVLGMVADSAGGYAAMTLVPAGSSVLTVEYKINLVAPADGDQLIARGRVLRSGRTLIVTEAQLYAVAAERETLCAVMQQTIMVMHGKPERHVARSAPSDPGAAG